MRRQHEAAVKARVALEAIKGEKTIAQIAGEYGIHPNQTRLWRDRALAALPGVFSKGAAKSEKDHAELEEELFRQIGRFKVENDETLCSMPRGLPRGRMHAAPRGL